MFITFSKHLKVGAAVVSCRRGGNTATFADAKEKYGEPLVERDSFTSFPDGK